MAFVRQHGSAALKATTEATRKQGAKAKAKLAELGVQAKDAALAKAKAALSERRARKTAAAARVTPTLSPAPQAQPAKPAAAPQNLRQEAMAYFTANQHALHNETIKLVGQRFPQAEPFARTAMVNEIMARGHAMVMSGQMEKHAANPIDAVLKAMGAMFDTVSNEFTQARTQPVAAPQEQSLQQEVADFRAFGGAGNVRLSKAGKAQPAVEQEPAAPRPEEQLALNLETQPAPEVAKDTPIQQVAAPARADAKDIDNEPVAKTDDELVVTQADNDDLPTVLKANRRNYEPTAEDHGSGAMLKLGGSLAGLTALYLVTSGSLNGALDKAGKMFSGLSTPAVSKATMVPNLAPQKASLEQETTPNKDNITGSVNLTQRIKFNDSYTGLKADGVEGQEVAAPKATVNGKEVEIKIVKTISRTGSDKDGR
jgi:hypothetical protein